jgi:membrane protease YdiL (CAAX protease family)
MGKGSQVFKSLIPPVFLIVLQVVSYIFISTWSAVVFIYSSHFTSMHDFQNKLVNFATKVENSGVAFILYSVIGILVFGFMIKAIKANGNYGYSFKASALRGWMIPVLLLLSLAVQAVTEYVMNFTIIIMPNAGQEYLDLMEQAGLAGDDISLIMLIYAGILGPIVEELAFRGLSFRYLRGAFGFWTANIIQAAMFGFFHMNLIQGIYTFVVGLILGYLAEKSGNITICIVFHIFFNTIAGYITILLEKTYINPFVYGLSLLLSLCVTYLGLIIFSNIVTKWKGQRIDHLVSDDDILNR